MRRKRGLCLLLAASMALGSSFTALAADKKIDTVKLSFSYSKAPESGDEIGDITVKAGSSGFEVDSAEYTNIEDQDTWRYTGGKGGTVSQGRIQVLLYIQKPLLSFRM